eukprot:RCo012654
MDPFDLAQGGAVPGQQQAAGTPQRWNRGRGIVPRVALTGRAISRPGIPAPWYPNSGGSSRRDMRFSPYRGPVQPSQPHPPASALKQLTHSVAVSSRQLQQAFLETRRLANVFLQEMQAGYFCGVVACLLRQVRVLSQAIKGIHPKIQKLFVYIFSGAVKDPGTLQQAEALLQVLSSDEANVGQLHQLLDQVCSTPELEKASAVMHTLIGVLLASEVAQSHAAGLYQEFASEMSNPSAAPVPVESQPVPSPEHVDKLAQLCTRDNALFEQWKEVVDSGAPQESPFETLEAILLLCQEAIAISEGAVRLCWGLVGAACFVTSAKVQHQDRAAVDTDLVKRLGAAGNELQSLLPRILNLINPHTANEPISASRHALNSALQRQTAARQQYHRSTQSMSAVPHFALQEALVSAILYAVLLCPEVLPNLQADPDGLAASELACVLDEVGAAVGQIREGLVVFSASLQPHLSPDASMVKHLVGRTLEYCLRASSVLDELLHGLM